MFAEILIALGLGIVFGVFTGLIPGIHINLVSLFVVSLLGWLLGFSSPVSLAVFISAMAITHTFLDIIPAVFLGAPDSDAALGVLPGHKLMMKGYAYQAVKLTVIGSFFSLLIVLAFVPLLVKIIPLAYEILSQWIGWILLGVVVFMIAREKKLKNIFLAVLVFMMSGILGLIVFNMPKVENSLFAMLTGLFGVSMLVISIKQRIKVPEQNTKDFIRIGKKKTIKSLLAAVFSGSLVSFFPGLGPAQGAVIGSEIIKSVENYSFLVLLGGVNTVNMVVSFVTLYTIDKARNGAVVAISEIIKIDFNLFVLFLIIALIAGGIAAAITLFVSKGFSKIISRINYRKLCFGVIVFIAVVAFLLSGFLGLLILAVAASIGLVPNLTGIKRSHAMGCLLLPVILWFIF